MPLQQFPFVPEQSSSQQNLRPSNQPTTYHDGQWNGKQVSWSMKTNVIVHDDDQHEEP